MFIRHPCVMKTLPVSTQMEGTPVCAITDIVVMGVSVLPKVPFSFSKEIE